jgi:lipoprotein-anchoring transpeptidase ErfK/SrfK
MFWYNFFMDPKFSRRELLKLAGLSLAGLAMVPLDAHNPAADTGDLVRVGTTSVSIYSQAWDKSRILFQRFRDEILHVYYPVISEQGPSYNPLWFRVWGGYVHSANLQRVHYRYNPVVSQVPEKGMLAEVTVAKTQSMRYTRWTGWTPVYRLYYQSLHWVIGLDEGPDGAPWYRLQDELLGTQYNVPASHLRQVQPQELEPISPDVAPEKKRIEVSLVKQTVTAFEDEKAVFTTRCSSGMPQRVKPEGEIPTETPKGTFHIQNKMPSKHMGDGKMTSDIEAYELPGVPWVSFFEPITGVAFHGTYWHMNYGVPMSHGCVNLSPEDARWIFRWSTPVSTVNEWDHRGMGTLVTVV